jgi:hypothetical protein
MKSNERRPIYRQHEIKNKKGKPRKNWKDELQDDLNKIRNWRTRNNRGRFSLKLICRTDSIRIHKDKSEQEDEKINNL